MKCFFSTEKTGVEKHRYGFNGKENDNEVKGTANQQDYGMRIYDPRAGRFLSVDPLTKKYPWMTPYAFAENSPIANIDLDGLEVSCAADGRVLMGPFQSDPLKGGRLSGTPPPNLFTYNNDQSNRVVTAKPVAKPRINTQDNLRLSNQVLQTKQMVEQTPNPESLQAYVQPNQGSLKTS